MMWGPVVLLDGRCLPAAAGVGGGALEDELCVSSGGRVRCDAPPRAPLEVTGGDTRECLSAAVWADATCPGTGDALSAFFPARNARLIFACVSSLAIHEA